MRKCFAMKMLHWKLQPLHGVEDGRRGAQSKLCFILICLGTELGDIFEKMQYGIEILVVVFASL